MITVYYIILLCLCHTVHASESGIIGSTFLCRVNVTLNANLTSHVCIYRFRNMHVLKTEKEERPYKKLLSHDYDLPFAEQLRYIMAAANKNATEACNKVYDIRESVSYTASVITPTSDNVRSVSTVWATGLIDQGDPISSQQFMDLRYDRCSNNNETNHSTDFYYHDTPDIAEMRFGKVD